LSCKKTLVPRYVEKYIARAGIIPISVAPIPFHNAPIPSCLAMSFKIVYVVAKGEKKIFLVRIFPKSSLGALLDILYEDD
jgi:hypothetical protein